MTLDRLAFLMRLARRPFDIQKQPVILLLVFQAPGIVRLPCKNALSGSLFIADAGLWMSSIGRTHEFGRQAAVFPALKHE